MRGDIIGGRSRTCTYVGIKPTDLQSVPIAALAYDHTYHQGDRRPYLLIRACSRRTVSMSH